MAEYGTIALAGLPPRVTICEVGPRDGLQNESTVLPAEVKVEFIERLVAAGHTVVESTSFVHPKWVPQLADAGGRPGPAAPGARGALPGPGAQRAGLSRALERGVTDIAVFGSATETSPSAT